MPGYSLGQSRHGGQRLNVSARAYHRILKACPEPAERVSCTIAGMEGARSILLAHLAEPLERRPRVTIYQYANCSDSREVVLYAYPQEGHMFVQESLVDEGGWLDLIWAFFERNARS